MTRKPKSLLLMRRRRRSSALSGIRAGLCGTPATTHATGAVPARQDFVAERQTSGRNRETVRKLVKRMRKLAEATEAAVTAAFDDRVGNFASAAIGLLVAGSLASTALCEPPRIENYVLPKYPEIYNRAGVEGTLSVNVTFEDGAAVKVEVVDLNFRNDRGHAATHVEGFVNAVKTAVAGWRAMGPVESVALEMVFQLAPYMDPFEGKKSPFHQYDVFEKEGVPTKIVIKARRLAPPRSG